MALLERINAGGTTVVMATHAADFVDRMQKRVIELVAGQIVRDERESGYGNTAALPIIGADTSINSTGDHTAAAAAALAATTRPQGIVTASEQPQIIETTDIVIPTPVFESVEEITMDAVPAIPSAYDTGEIDDLGDLNELFNMNESKPVQRLDPPAFADQEPVSAGDPLTKPPVDTSSLPLAERLRLQAQARAKEAGENDQNVGPVR
jgi:cell division transport system ATP-binding protein